MMVESVLSNDDQGCELALEQSSETAKATAGLTLLSGRNSLRQGPSKRSHEARKLMSAQARQIELEALLADPKI